MAEWSVMDRDWPYNQFDPYQFNCNQYLPENPEEVLPCLPPALPPPPLPPPPPPPPPAQDYFPPQTYAAMMYQEPSTSRGLQYATPQQPQPVKGDNPREIRNKAEKQRRDKLNQSIGELASMVPPVVAASRKIDKTGVLRLTAHYLRAHQYVFGDSLANGSQQFSAMSTRAVLSLLNGFLLTTTYRGLIVVVSQNVQQFLGYSELDLLGQNVLTIIHEDDRQLMRDQLMPKRHMLGPNGELLVPDEPEGKKQVAETLAGEKRRFIIRFKKLGQRSEPSQYVTCHVEGALRKSDRACRGYNRCCQMVRRARARGDNPCSSGNDVVFVGMVRLATDTFITESSMESYRMEYRTRHSVDGQIIQTEQRISLVTGYMTHEVNGVNAMNFMHRDDVRWVVIALREMYDQHRLVGESCYRLMAKNGQFIYLKTRGRLEVDSNTRAVTSFVCTNTVVDEHEGKHLIKLMKKKFMLMVNNNEESLQEIEEAKEVNEQNLAVEDPRQLEKVILHLVTNLPSPQSEEEQIASPDRSAPASRLAIIPPKKERIVSAIEKIYSVIKTFPETGGFFKSKPDENSPAEAMAYKRQVAGRCPQLADEPGRITLYKETTDQPLHKLPNFNEVYQRRHADAPLLLHDLNPFTAANSSLRPAVRGLASMARTTEMPQPQYTELTTIKPNPMGIIGANNLASTEKSATLKYHVYLTPVGASMVEQGGADLAMTLPGGSTVTIGTKRTRDYADLDVVSKKKPAETVVSPAPAPPQPEPQERPQQAQNNDTYSLIDDSLLSLPQIENAMNSLEKSMDPTFPELLISQEVEEILHQIEENSPNNNAPR